MKHEPITLEDPTRDGTGRAILYLALTNLVRTLAPVANTKAGAVAAFDLPRDIADAAALMKGLYPENAHEVDHLLKTLGVNRES